MSYGKHGEAKLVTVAPFLTAIGFLLLAGVPWVPQSSNTEALTWALVLLSCIPMTLGHGLTGPNINAMISRQAGDSGQGTTLGISQGIGSLARAVAPPVGGALYLFHPSCPYVSGALLLAAIGAFACSIRRDQEAALDHHLSAETTTHD